MPGVPAATSAWLKRKRRDMPRCRARRSHARRTFASAVPCQSGFKMWGFTVYGLRCTVHGVRFTVYGSRCTVYGVRFTVYRVGVRVTV